MSENLKPLEGDRPITFNTLFKMFSSHDAATVATAIEKHGIYALDDYGRIAKADDDTDNGWVFRFDAIGIWRLKHHEYHMSGKTQTAPRNTQSRAMGLLAMYHKADKIELDDAEEYNFFSEMASFGWPVDDTPDFDAIADGVVTVPAEELEPARKWRRDGEIGTSQLIGAMAYLLASSKPKYKNGERPNAKAIAEMAGDLAKSKTTETIKTGSWRNIIGCGIKKYTGA